jgi:hypothetical protein
MKRWGLFQELLETDSTGGFQHVYDGGIVSVLKMQQDMA